MCKWTIPGHITGKFPIPSERFFHWKKFSFQLQLDWTHFHSEFPVHEIERKVKEMSRNAVFINNAFLMNGKVQHKRKTLRKVCKKLNDRGWHKQWKSHVSNVIRSNFIQETFLLCQLFCKVVSCHLANEIRVSGLLSLTMKFQLQWNTRRWWWLHWFHFNLVGNASEAHKLQEELCSYCSYWFFLIYFQYSVLTLRVLDLKKTQ